MRHAFLNICFKATLVLAVAAAALVLYSWIVAAVEPSSGVRPLLGAEGVRWFFGTFATNVSGPPFAWLVLCSMAAGIFAGSGLGGAAASLFRGRSLGLRSSRALAASAATLVLIVCVVVLLAFVPRAVLLGVGGGLWPGPFSSAVVPMAAFALAAVSAVYGLAGGTYAGLADVYNHMCRGLSALAAVVPVYVMAVELYYMFVFVFT